MIDLLGRVSLATSSEAYWLQDTKRYDRRYNSVGGVGGVKSS
jgi:hypothetical protein